MDHQRSARPRLRRGAGAPGTLDALEQSEVADRVVVTDRTGTVHYDTHASTNIDQSAAAALQRVRAIPKSPLDLTQWVARWQAVHELAVTHGIDQDPTVVPVMQGLDGDAATLLSEPPAEGPPAAGSEMRTFRERLQAIQQRSQRRTRPVPPAPADPAAQASHRWPAETHDNPVHDHYPDGHGHGPRP